MYYYIINPAAGDGSINDIQAKLKSTLHKLNIEGEFVKTIGPGDAAKLATRAIEQGYKTIVAVGGDKTVDEVATAAYKSGSTAAVGVIPIGKHNMLASRLGIDNWRQAGEALAARRLAKVQLMEVNGELFIHELSIEAPTITKKDGSTKSKPIHYQLKTNDDLSVQGAALSISVTNQKIQVPDADNSLLFKITGPARQGGGLLSKLGIRRGNKPGQSTQLHATRGHLDLNQQVEASYDNKELSAKELDIALTDSEIAFVCRRSKVS